jgi:ABC-type phosphate transport system auxiliary subunit
MVTMANPSDVKARAVLESENSRLHRELFALQSELASIRAELTKTQQALTKALTDLAATMQTSSVQVQ